VVKLSGPSLYPGILGDGKAKTMTADMASDGTAPQATTRKPRLALKFVQCRQWGNPATRENKRALQICSKAPTKVLWVRQKS